MTDGLERDTIEMIRYADRYLRDSISACDDTGALAHAMGQILVAIELLHLREREIAEKISARSTTSAA